MTGFIASKFSYFLRKYTEGAFQWFSFLNVNYRNAVLSGLSCDDFVMKFTNEYLMQEVGNMREAKRRTLVLLISQDDFIKKNFGVADYSKEYHKKVLRRWKAHLKKKEPSSLLMAALLSLFRS